MFKKLLVVLLCLATIAGIGGTVYYYKEYTTAVDEKQVLIQQNAQLQSAIDAIGPTTTAYTVVSSDTKCGDVIEAGNIQEMTIPVSSITERTVTSVDQIVGLLYKVDIQPGTVLTLDMVMTEEYAETVYEKDMSFSFLPLGIEAGDYVNICLTLPYGQTYYVMTHKRVEQVVTSTNTIKIYVTAAEQQLWQSAMRDYGLYKDIGVSLYVDKYVEPGIHTDTVAFYPVRKEMEASVMQNVNITNKKLCINSDLRDEIDAMIAAVVQTEGSKLYNQVTSEASSINTSVSFYVDEGNTSSVVTGATTTSESGSSSSDEDYIDFTEPTEEDLTGALDEISDGVTSTQKTDSYGNGASVTDTEKTEAGGDPLFSDEETIE